LVVLALYLAVIAYLKVRRDRRGDTLLTTHPAASLE
jgi:hypothetical protein